MTELSHEVIEKLLEELWQAGDPNGPLAIRPSHMILNTTRVQEFANRAGISFDDAFVLLERLANKGIRGKE